MNASVSDVPVPSPLSLDDALARASEELQFPSYYQSSVRPLLRNPEGRWPHCCGGGCEPCAQTLIRVALRALELMGTPRQSPPPDF
ncbi:hypothetical protein HRD49_23240 [Corallococcus exiguus]|uniref:hypothetical protein n=1 Tax=Corallococcus TaxID=83461 RepID=UPI00156083CB|nr:MULTISPECIES: hypothetical protein [Corallococcus]NRD51695.1 hypothetical protein [Corallococcus exiguus]NRD64672.1 hypothetical protein [Corallococcus exiguus]